MPKDNNATSEDSQASAENGREKSAAKILEKEASGKGSMAIDSEDLTRKSDGYKKEKSRESAKNTLDFTQEVKENGQELSDAKEAHKAQMQQVMMEILDEETQARVAGISVSEVKNANPGDLGNFSPPSATNLSAQSMGRAAPAA